MSSEETVHIIELTIASNPKQICVARAAAEAFATSEGFSKEAADEVGLALNEALANVIEHAYGGDDGQKIVMKMSVNEVDERRFLKLTIRDFGRQVEPETIKGRNLEDVRPGGLGVHIMKAVMDRVEYRAHPQGGTELTIVKFSK